MSGSRRRPSSRARNSHRVELSTGLIPGTLADRLRVGVVWNAAQPAYAAVMRRDLFLAVDFPPGGGLLYDIWATYSFLCAGHDLYYVDERLSDYRVHGGALTSKGFAEPEDRFFETLIADHADHPDLVADARARIGRLQWWRATEALERGDDDLARTEFAKSAGHLSGPRAILARLAAASGPVRTALRLTKATASKLRADSFEREKAPTPDRTATKREQAVPR